MLSKIVSDCLKSSQSVENAITHFSERIVARVKQRFDDETGAACGTMLAGLQRKLHHDTEALRVADAKNLDELGDGAAPRRQRDEQAHALHGQLVQVQQYIGAVYGADAVKALALDGPIPADPAQLHQYATRVLERLPHFTPPPTDFPHAHFDRATWIARLSPAVTVLGAALARVSGDARDVQATLHDKNEALDQYTHTFSLVANLVSALLAASDQADLAAKLRPSARRPGSTVEAAELTRAPQAPTPAIAAE